MVIVSAGHRITYVEAFWISTGIVTIAEIGDKTQLLALVLAARFRKSVPIIAGIFVATLVNHGIAGALGAWFVAAVDPTLLRWGVGLSFIAMAAWMLIPDRIDVDAGTAGRFGVFGTTAIAFFLAEIGDKTQIATIALTARYDAYAWVVAGTTLGMMIANVPAVLLGDRMAGKISLKLVHGVAAVVFAALGMIAIADLTPR